MSEKEIQREIQREINEIETALACCDHITSPMQADAEERLEELKKMLTPHYQ